MEVIGRGRGKLKSGNIKGAAETADKQNEVKRGHRERQTAPKGQGAKSPAYSLWARAAGLPKWTDPLVNSVDNVGKQIGCPWERKVWERPTAHRGLSAFPKPSQEGVMEMKDLFTKMKTFILDEEGASAVEYGLLVAGIAVVVMAAIYGIGTALNTTYTQVQTQLGS